jgi:hypothetical protein
MKRDVQVGELQPGMVLVGWLVHGPIEDVSAPFHGKMFVKFRDCNLPVVFRAEGTFTVEVPAERGVMWRVVHPNDSESLAFHTEAYARDSARRLGGTVQKLEGEWVDA